MKFKHVIVTLVMAGVFSSGSVANAESGFEGALNGIKNDMRSARMALRHVNSSNSKDLLRRLAKAERQLGEAMLTLTYIQESVAGARLASATRDQESTRQKSFWAAAPKAPVPARPSPISSPAPTSSPVPTSPTKPLQTGGGFM